MIIGSNKIKTYQFHKKCLGRLVREPNLFFNSKKTDS